MNFEKIIQQSLVNIVKELYHQDIDPTCLQVNKTRKDQEGDFTVVVFPLSKIVRLLLRPLPVNWAICW